MTTIPPLGLSLELEGLDGNAYSLLGAFSHQARREGVPKETIDAIRTEAMSGDYDHLIRTLMAHCDN